MASARSLVCDSPWYFGAFLFNVLGFNWTNTEWLILVWTAVAVQSKTFRIQHRELYRSIVVSVQMDDNDLF